jgi:hypothetical protein
MHSLRLPFRSLLALAVVTLLALPLHAQPANQSWTDAFRERLVKIVRKLGVRSFGDGLTIPRP